MNVVVCGLSARDEAAFSIFLRRTLAGWTMHHAAAGRSSVLPKTDLVVADLVSLGLVRWSETTQIELLFRLQGSPAVLLVPSHDRTWAAMDKQLTLDHGIVWLHKPYGTKDMHLALQTALGFIGDGAVGTDTQFPSTRESDPLNSGLDAHPSAVAASGLTHDVGALPLPPSFDFNFEGLSSLEFQDRVTAAPNHETHRFLRQLASALLQHCAFEVKLTAQHSFFFHPVEGWVASNAPKRVLSSICRSEKLSRAVCIQTLSASHVPDYGHRPDMKLYELNTFLSELVDTTLGSPPSHWQLPKAGVNHGRGT